MRQTKAQLAADNATLRARVSQLEAQLQAERFVLRVAAPLPEHMQRARDMAIASGRTVRVG